MSGKKPEIYLKRKFDAYLADWKSRDDRLPLIISGLTAEALAKEGVELAYYKKEGSTLEMDFFVRCGNDLVPIEVKAGNNQAKSLKTLISSASYKDVRWGVKFVHGNVGFMNNVLTIPQWCAFLLLRYFDKLRGKNLQMSGTI